MLFLSLKSVFTHWSVPKELKEEDGLLTSVIFVCLFLLGAGADFVMMGGMFAGHDQSGKKSLIFIDNYVLIIKSFLFPLVPSFQDALIENF